jgi:hypothetical protein
MPFQILRIKFLQKKSLKSVPLPRISLLLETFPYHAHKRLCAAARFFYRRYQTQSLNSFALVISPGHWMSLPHLLQVKNPHPPLTILRKILNPTPYELAVRSWQTETLLTSLTAVPSASYVLRLNYVSRLVTVTHLFLEIRRLICFSSFSVSQTSSVINTYVTCMVRKNVFVVLENQHGETVGTWWLLIGDSRVVHLTTVNVMSWYICPNLLQIRIL